MNPQSIVSELKKKRDRINRAIAALDEGALALIRIASEYRGSWR
jgi:hypothetical protein